MDHHQKVEDNIYQEKQHLLSPNKSSNNSNYSSSFISDYNNNKLNTPTTNSGSSLTNFQYQSTTRLNGGITPTKIISLNSSNNNLNHENYSVPNPSNISSTPIVKNGSIPSTLVNHSIQQPPPKIQSSYINSYRMRSSPSTGSNENQSVIYKKTLKIINHFKKLSGNAMDNINIAKIYIYENCMNQENMFLIFCICSLVFFTANERLLFKITIDRMLPYKFIMIQLIFLVSCFLFSCITIYKLLFTTEITLQMRKFPHSKIVLMAIIDTIQFVLLTLSTASVSPTMTVILMHVSTIFIVLGSSFIFPMRKYSKDHYSGIFYIGLAVGFGLFKPLFSLLWSWIYSLFSRHSYDGYNVDLWEVLNSILYVVAASMQGLVSIYKEKSIIEWSQPVSVYYISAWLFFYQFLITLFISIVFYIFKALFQISPLSTSARSIYDGWMCFMGALPSNSVDKSYDDSLVDCSDSLSLIIGYALSSLFILVFMNRILQMSSNILGRVILFAILISFIVMCLYDLYRNDDNNTIGLFDLISLILLLLGMEIYGRDPEPDVDVTTNYSSIDTQSFNFDIEISPKLKQPN